MNKNKVLTSIVLMVASVVALVACGSNMIKPIPKDLVGNVTVRNVTVTTSSAVTSTTISSRVKQAVEKEAREELKGNRQVDLKINLDHWNGSENVAGGVVTQKLIGTSTNLNGVVDLVDIHSGQLLGKYTIVSKYQSGGLLSAVKTYDFNNTDQYVIDKFAEYTIYHLE